jgi:hypothetical protein
MIIVAQQPHYLPWLGFWELIARADRVVFLDNVQWLKQGGQRRARLLNGTTPRWLSIPLIKAKQSDHLGQLQCAAPQSWAMDHWYYIKQCYGSRPYFRSQVESILLPFYQELAHQTDNTDLISINQKLTFLLAPHLSIECLEAKSLLASELNIENKFKTERLIEICRSLGGDVYYSPAGATKYIDIERFRQADIDLFWQRFQHQSYNQGANQEFVSHLSVVDALANVPLDHIREMLMPNPWRPIMRREKVLFHFECLNKSFHQGL